MDIYLAATTSVNNLQQIVGSSHYSQSFFNLATFVERRKPEVLQHKSIAQKFILDSGAFTYMKSNHNGKKPDWGAYIDEYAKYIVDNNVTQYMELDIDNIVGYDKVLEFRKALESKTNRPCIPVWHTSRGFDEFRKMCDGYAYVAIGGFALNSQNIKDTSRDEKQISTISSLVQYAHKHNAKVHGLGFTTIQYLPQIHFDSVDSTSWLRASVYGTLMYFDGSTIRRIEKKYRGEHLEGELNRTQLQEFNIKEWLKFAHYAKSNL